MGYLHVEASGSVIQFFVYHRFTSIVPLVPSSPHLPSCRFRPAQVPGLNGQYGASESPRALPPVPPGTSAGAKRQAQVPGLNGGSPHGDTIDCIFRYSSASLNPAFWHTSLIVPKIRRVRL